MSLLPSSAKPGRARFPACHPDLPTRAPGPPDPSTRMRMVSVTVLSFGSAMRTDAHHRTPYTGGKPATSP